MKLCIFGSRGVTDLDLALNIIETVLEETKWAVTEVVSGTARGADTLGEEWAEQMEIPVKRFPADWGRYGKRAGYVRNGEMAEYCDCAIGLWDGESRGTSMMVDCLVAAGKPFAIYNQKTEEITFAFPATPEESVQGDPD